MAEEAAIELEEVFDPFDIREGIDLKKLVARRHPDYAESIEHWLFANAAYCGGRKWFDWSFDPGDWGIPAGTATGESHSHKNLFKFYKEGDNEYKERKRRTHRANHTKRVVDTVNQYLFREKPARELKSVPEHVKGFWEKTDNRHQDISRFVRDVDQWASVYGMVYVVIDRAAGSSVLATEDTLPYAYIVTPQYVLDMAHDQDGKLQWIMMAEDYRPTTLDDEAGIQVRYRFWTRVGWYLIEEISEGTGRSKKKKYAVTQSGRHELGYVPVIQYADQEGTRWSAPSLTQDIVYMDRTLVNYGSLLDEIMYEQTFSQLTMPAEAVVPGSTEEAQMMAAAKNRIFTYSSTSPGAKPEYISPDASQAMVIAQQIERIKKEIYAVTGTDNDANSQSQSTGKSYASGVVRRYDQTQIENILLDKARSLEKLEDKMMWFVLLWMGEEDPVVEENWVVYPDKYDIRGLEAEFEIAKNMNDLESPVEAMRQQMKLVIAKANSRLTPEEREKFMQEVNEWQPAYIVEREFRENEQNIKVFTAESQALAMANQADDAAEQDVDENGDGKVQDDVAKKGIESEPLKDRKSPRIRGGKKAKAGANISGTSND